MSGKKKTTFAKLNREQKLREKRVEKQMRKDARKLAAANGEPIDDQPVDEGALIDRPIDESGVFRRAEKAA